MDESDASAKTANEAIDREWEALRNEFLPLYAGLNVTQLSDVPLLAHYTNTAVMESILKNEEIWLSNPLYMNDHEEIAFGVNEGRAKVASSSQIREIFKDKAVYKRFLDSYFLAYAGFADEQALGIFVLCLSSHNEFDLDGRLSLWRSYGADASGACIVFDPSRITTETDTPFLFQKVAYAPTATRLSLIDKIIEDFCAILKPSHLTAMVAHRLAYILFDRIMLFSLFNKHIGFSEEDEWRLVYRRDLDNSDKYSGMISYSLGRQGIEPKLKLDLRHLPDFQPSGINLDEAIDRIILGPTSAGAMSRKMVERMLEILGKSRIRNRVHSSSIPYRSTP